MEFFIDSISNKLHADLNIYCQLFHMILNIRHHKFVTIYNLAIKFGEIVCRPHTAHFCADKQLETSVDFERFSFLLIFIIMSFILYIYTYISLDNEQGLKLSWFVSVYSINNFSQFENFIFCLIHYSIR